MRVVQSPASAGRPPGAACGISLRLLAAVLAEAEAYVPSDEQQAEAAKEGSPVGPWPLPGRLRRSTASRWMWCA